MSDLFSLLSAQGFPKSALDPDFQETALGQGIAPRGWHPLADGIGADDLARYMAGVAAMVGLRASARAEADAESDMLRVEIAAARRRIALAAGVDAASVRIMIEL